MLDAIKRQWNKFKNRKEDALTSSSSGISTRQGYEVYELPNGWNDINLIPDYISSGKYYWCDGEQGYAHRLPIKCPELPSWVEKYQGFTPTLWALTTWEHQDTNVYLVTYNPGANASEPPFAKIVFTSTDGTPFKQMGNMYKEVSIDNAREVELHGSGVEKNYYMDLDGKIRDKTRQFLPDASMVSNAMEDLHLLYEEWFRFPDVEDLGLVAQLSSAWLAVWRMYEEERNGDIKKQICDLQAKITSCRDSIATLERRENKIYEEAADGMNLLEKHGIDVKKIEEEEEMLVHRSKSKLENTIDSLKKVFYSMGA